MNVADLLAANAIDPAEAAKIQRKFNLEMHVDKTGKVLLGKDAEQAKKQELRQAIKDPTTYHSEYQFVRNTDYWLNKFVTLELNDLKDAVRKVAPTDHNVIIYGESGTGKELIAKALHGTRQGHFVDVNCGGFPEHLLESELFGHVKGAFTGAYSDKIGLFAAANGGTIFLDEVAELPLHMQTKLLRVLQEGVIRRVGSTTNECIKCRIVAATHKTLYPSEAFRHDLYWRLSQVELTIPPLRDRPADVEAIAKSMGVAETKFVNDIGVSYDITKQQWPGNVRELQRFILRRNLGLK